MNMPETLVYKGVSEHGRDHFLFHASSMFFGRSKQKMLLVMPTTTERNAFYDSKIGQVMMIEMPSIPP